MIKHPSRFSDNYVTYFDIYNGNSWEIAKKRLLLPLEDRIGVMPACQCRGNSPNDAHITLIEAIASAKSFADLCPLVRNAEVHLSFWGEKYLTIENYPGTVDIDAFARRAIELIQEDQNFKQSERSHGKTISPLITAIYFKSDEQVKKSSLMTRICVVIRNLPTWYKNILKPYTCSRVRWLWIERENTENPVYYEKGYRKRFSLYNDNQHRSVFSYKFGEIWLSCQLLKSEIKPKFWDREEILAASSVFETKCDAIMSAAAQGFIDTLETLLDSENYTDKGFSLQPRTILHGDYGDDIACAILQAATHKQWDCVELLIKRRQILPEALVRVISLAEFYGENSIEEKLRQHFMNHFE